MTLHEGKVVLPDILTTYKETNCVDKTTLCGTQISSRQWSSRTRSVRLHSACTVARSATHLKELALTNFRKRDDVQQLKHMIRTVARRSEGGADKRGNTGLQGCVGF